MSAIEHENMLPIFNSHGHVYFGLITDSIFQLKP